MKLINDFLNLTIYNSMKIFCLIIFFNLVSLRYLNLEKLSSTYHDIKKTNFDNRNLEDDDE